MKAILATRCGCQQAMEIRWPPPPKILLPLKKPREWGVYSLDPKAPCLPPPDVSNPCEIRTFALTDQPRSPSQEADYAEE